MNMNLPYAFSQGILNQGLPQQQLPYNLGQPVLTNPNQPQAPNPPALSMSPYGNARGSSRTPQIPSQQINMGGEGLMRIGAAGLGAGAQGPLAQMGAMGNMYGGLMDYNRQREMEAFEIEEGRRVEEQRRADIMRKLNARNSAAADKKDTENPEETAKVRVALQNAEDVLQGFQDYDDVVGWRSLFTKRWDEITDNKRQNIRLKIESMKVDRVLANIAQTKGAISEREMDIFMSDQPSWMAGEEIWTAWVQDYIAALKVMNTNLANGTTTLNGASLPQDRTTTATPSAPAVSEDELNETDRIVNGG